MGQQASEESVIEGAQQCTWAAGTELGIEAIEIPRRSRASQRLRIHCTSPAPSSAVRSHQASAKQYYWTSSATLTCPSSFSRSRRDVLCATQKQGERWRLSSQTSHLNMESQTRSTARTKHRKQGHSVRIEVIENASQDEEDEPTTHSCSSATRGEQSLRSRQWTSPEYQRSRDRRQKRQRAGANPRLQK